MKQHGSVNISKQNQSRVSTLVSCFDQIATTEQLAVLTGKGTPSAALQATTRTTLNDLMMERFAAAYESSGLAVPPMMRKGGELLAGSVDGRFADLRDRGVNFQWKTHFTTQRLSPEDAQGLLPWRSRGKAQGCC